MRRLNSATLSALRFFEATARLGSFTRAAEELCVTQSAVSQHVKAVEDRLGRKLFFRLAGKIALTDDGKKFGEVVTRALRELEEAADILVAPRSSKIEVRLRTGPSFALGWIIQRLPRLHARYPKIKLQLLREYGYIEPSRRDFDLAVEMALTAPPRMHVELLMEEYLTPVCTREYLAQHPLLISPADLLRCVLLHDGYAWPSASEDAEWRVWLNAVGASGVDSSEGHFFPLASMAIEAALSHQGIAMGRLSLVEPLLASRELVAPFSQRIKSPASYHLMYPIELANRTGISEVADWLREEMGITRQARTVTQSDATVMYPHPMAPKTRSTAPPSPA